jgi:superfamily II DNA or RNA helicase
MHLYFRTLDMVSTIFAHFNTSLGDKRWAEEKKCPETRIVEMYHGHLDPVAQENIPVTFSKTDSVLRCVITTLAFGLGINIPNVDYVLHWGPPADLLTYWQEVGRCARDGRPGKAIMYCPPYTKHQKMVNAGFLELIKKRFSGCIREGVLLALQVKGMDKESILEMCHGPMCCGFCSNVSSNL